MKELNVINQGDLVLSKAGRDVGRYFLTVKVDDEFAFIVDGKVRKVKNPKKKKLKHLQKIFVESQTWLANQIQSGKPVSNERVYRAVKSATQKIQED